LRENSVDVHNFLILAEVRKRLRKKEEAIPAMITLLAPEGLAYNFFATETNNH
jgi:hypothetical protein